MNSLLTTLQLLLLLPTLTLAVMSWRTSRRLRGRHHGMVAFACVFGVLAIVLSLFSVADIFSAEQPVDPGLTFLPPLVTLGACAWVVWRGMRVPRRRAFR
jgi:hypothetical protein